MISLSCALALFVTVVPSANPKSSTRSPGTHGSSAVDHPMHDTVTVMDTAMDTNSATQIDDDRDLDPTPHDSPIERKTPTSQTATLPQPSTETPTNRSGSVSRAASTMSRGGVTATEPEDADRGEFTLEAVVVEASNGNSILGAEITLHASTDRVDENVSPPYGSTARDGVAIIDGLHRGRYDMVIRAEGFAQTHRAISIGPKPDSIEIELDEAVIQFGRVIDTDDRPVELATILARYPGGETRTVDVTDERGEFEVGELGSEPVTITAMAEGYTVGSVSNVVADPESTLEIRVAPGIELAGRVLHAISGAPIPAATVSVTRTDGRALESPGYATSVKNGHFVIAGLTPGEYRVSTAATGFIEEHSTLTLDKTVVGHEVRLAAGQSLRGQVVDLNGKPINLAIVRARSNDEPRSKPQVVRTDENGEFLFTDLTPEPHTITVIHGRFATTSRTIHPGEEITRWQLAPSEPSARRGSAFGALTKD